MKALSLFKVGTSKKALTVILLNTKQFEKALAPIIRMVSGKIAFSAFSHKAKAASPISVSPVLSKLIWVRAVQL